MESATPTDQDVSKSELNGVLTLMCAIVATVMVSIVVFGHWGSYGWMNRVSAIFLILTMAIFPLALAFTKKGRMSLLRSARTSELSLGYIWVLMATMLFNQL